MDNKSFIHDWASGAKFRGKEKRNGNISCDEHGVLYSYGKHYPLAYIHGKFAFVNTRGYSVSTARHIRYALDAVTHKVTVKLTEWGNVDVLLRHDILSAFKHAIKNQIVQIDVEIANANKKRYTDDAVFCLSRAAQLLDIASELYNNIYPGPSGNKAVLKSIRDASQRIKDAQRAAMQKPSKPSNEEKRAKRNERNAIAQKEALEKFLANDSDYNHNHLYDASQNPLLRVDGFGDHVKLNQDNVIITWRGATVDASKEIKARILALYQNWEQGGGEMIGESIGNFTIRAVCHDRVEVGCHTFAKSSIENLVKQIKGAN